MKNFLLPGALIVLVLTFQSCGLIFSLAVSIPDKKNIHNWKNDQFKVRIQQRMDFVGPAYLHFRVKKKRLGGIYYQTIVNESVSRSEYRDCQACFEWKGDSLCVNVCKKEVSTNK